MKQSIKKLPNDFGNGSEVHVLEHGAGRCVGWVRGSYWRIQFDSGNVVDFLPEKLAAKLVIPKP